VLSIQKPSTSTRCEGTASGMSPLSRPIQNVPPGTQTMPGDAASGALTALMPGAGDGTVAGTAGAP
jgi:hypothetical protein